MKTLKTLFLTLIMAIGFASTASATKDTLMLYSGHVEQLVGGVGNTITSFTTNVGDTIVFRNFIGMAGTFQVNTTTYTSVPLNAYFPGTGYVVTSADLPNFPVKFVLTNYTFITITVNNITTGVSENTNKIQFNSFPNPVTDELTINASTNLGKVTVMSLTGQVVFNETINENSTKVDFSLFAPGTYIVTVGNSTRKIIKQ